MALFGLFGGGRRRRAARAPRARRQTGAAAQRYLERVVQLEGLQRQRAQNRTRSAASTRAVQDDDRTVPIPPSVQREAERRWQRSQREREQAERKERAQEIRDRERQHRAEAKLIEKTTRARDRAIEAYMTHGFTRQEAEDVVDREPDWSTYDYGQNPARRRRRRNPGLASVAAEIAKDVVKGGLVAAAQEEAKEWRNRVHQGGWGYAVRQELKEPRFGRRRNPRGYAGRADTRPLCTVCGQRYHAGSYGHHTRSSSTHKAALLVGRTRRAVAVYNARRSNPARLEPNYADPKLRAMSARFHGRPDQILHLDAEQRRPPPSHVVLIGHERATVYRPPQGSERADADWEHEAGDRGPLRRNASGRRLLVADDRGRVYLVQGSSAMRFDPDRGLVG